MPDNNIEATLTMSNDVEARLIPEQGIQTQTDVVYLYNPEDITVKHDETLKGRGTTLSPLALSDDLLEKILHGGDTFVFEFDASQTVWEINHNLHKKPSVFVVDSADNVVVCSVRYNSPDPLTIELNAPFKGTASLN